MTTETERQELAQLVWRREGGVCLSYLISTLAEGYGQIERQETNTGYAMPNLAPLCEQAAELSAPVDDYEEAAIQAGWTQNVARMTGAVTYKKKGDKTAHVFESWQDLCQSENIEPYAREVFEHWAVSSWLAEKLEAAGEKVDTDFASLCVWARTTTGQSIACDYVMQQIALAVWDTPEARARVLAQ